MRKGNSTSVHAKTISLLCVFVLGTIVVAALWPFHVPNNAVSWLRDENGLRFNTHGSALSASGFRAVRPPNETGCSLEILLRPGRISGGGSILAFDSSPDPRKPFLLRQYGTSIALMRYLVDEGGKVDRPWFKVDHVLEVGKLVFVSVISDQNSIAFYVNGVLAQRFMDSRIVSRELTGVLVLANSTVDDSWTGDIKGLAIYNRSLSSSQISQHSQSWMSQKKPSLTEDQALTALYLFNERGGAVAHNQVDAATDLILPPKYFVLHPPFLRPTWEQYSNAGKVWKQWSFWEDLGVNVAGFVPVGFVFLAYFSLVKHIERPALTVIVLGFLLSFTVEVLQHLLPNRDSGMTDLLTNTFGTALGVLLYRFSSIRGLWTKTLEFIDHSSLQPTLQKLDLS